MRNRFRYTADFLFAIFYLASIFAFGAGWLLPTIEFAIHDNDNIAVIWVIAYPIVIGFIWSLYLDLKNG